MSNKIFNSIDCTVQNKVDFVEKAEIESNSCFITEIELFAQSQFRIDKCITRLCLINITFNKEFFSNNK